MDKEEDNFLLKNMNIISDGLNTEEEKIALANISTILKLLLIQMHHISKSYSLIANFIETGEGPDIEIQENASFYG